MDDFNLEEEYSLFLNLLDQSLYDMNNPGLTHFGVKGMKWGVRKERTAAEQRARNPITGFGPDHVVRKTRSGEELTLSKKPPTTFQQFIGRHSKGYTKLMNNSAYLTIKDSTGKKVGEASLDRRSKDEINLVWLGINRNERGKGYASAVMEAGVEFGKQSGAKRLTLEVPGNSPDAAHIYQKLGFKFVNNKDNYHSDPNEPIWGGLYNMELNFSDVKHTNVPEISREAILRHYGVKGMKWGVRHDPGHEGERAKTKKIDKLDKKYEKTANSMAGYIAVNNAIARSINPRIDAMNAKPEYQIDMTKNPKVQKKYLAEYRSELEKACNDAMKELGSNASGTKRLKIQVEGEGYDAGWTAHLEDIQHADAMPESFRIIPSFGKTGKVLGQKIVPLDDAELKHYGVKGMKWGVRQQRPPVDVVTTAKPGRRVKAKGGQRQPASEDAVTVATLHRTAKKSTTDALSTKELQLLVNRMNLEQQFQNLEKAGVRDTAGKKFVKDFLQNGGKDVTLGAIDKGAAFVPGGKAVKVGVGVTAAVAKAYVNKNAGGKKK